MNDRTSKITVKYSEIEKKCQLCQPDFCERYGNCDRRVVLDTNIKNQIIMICTAENPPIRNLFKKSRPE